MLSRSLLAGRGQILRPSTCCVQAGLARKDNTPSQIPLRGFHSTKLERNKKDSSSASGSAQKQSQPSQTNVGGDKSSQKLGTEDDFEIQTMVPSPLNIPGAGIPGFGLSFHKGASFDAAATTIIGLALVFFGGVGYVNWYKARVLTKIEEAFASGYDPALHIADQSKRTRTTHGEDGSKVRVENWDPHMRRKEQELVDGIINGSEQGYYYLVMGSKGTGKTTMMLDAMRGIDAEGVAICEAHADLEVFRLRLGKAINFEFNEDSQTGLFQRRDPREGGPRLDIERALNKLEKVALKLSAIRKKPLVMVFNNVHLFANNEESQLLLLQLQQRAETWAESGIMTLVFSTDDFWPYPLLRKNSNRMQVVSVSDLNPREALSAFRRLRTEMKGHAEPDHILSQALGDIGGRLSFMARVGRSNDILEATSTMRENEKGWLLSQIGLIPDCDDDVMDEQKICASSWLLLQEFVKKHKAEEERHRQLIEAGEHSSEPSLPGLSYHECRQIMTRADFIEFLDHINVVKIDVHHVIRPDSMLILQAAREIVEEEGFDDLLTNVRERIDEIEGLHRTRELIWKTSEDGNSLKILTDDRKKEFRI